MQIVFHRNMPALQRCTNKHSSIPCKHGAQGHNRLTNRPKIPHTRPGEHRKRDTHSHSYVAVEVLRHKSAADASLGAIPEATERLPLCLQLDNLVHNLIDSVADPRDLLVPLSQVPSLSLEIHHIINLQQSGTCRARQLRVTCSEGSTQGLFLFCCVFFWSLSNRVGCMIRRQGRGSKNQTCVYVGMIT